MTWSPQLVGRWAIDVSPPGALQELSDGTWQANPLNPVETVRITIAPTSSPAFPTTSSLTAAGQNAVAGQIAGYQTAAKLTSIAAASGIIGATGCKVTATGAWYDALPADAPAQVTAIAAVLATSTNVT